MLLTTCFACGTAPRPPDGRLPPGDFTVPFAHGDRQRRYLVHVPPGGSAALPVVMVLHGAADDAVDNRSWLGLDSVADREGFVAVYPDGTGPFPNRIHMWNSGACCGTAQWADVDDVGFLVAVLDDVARHLPVDPTRQYVAGFSNGAMMAYRLAEEASDRIAAIVTVAGARDAVLGATIRPMPVLHVHSVDDPIVPFSGGRTTILPGLFSIQHPAVDDVVGAWARHDGCPATPTTTGPDVASLAAVDSPSFSRTTWGPCTGDTEVTLLRLRGAGHVWPGPAPTLRNLFVGPATSAIDVREEMWRFFRRFTRRG